MDLPALTYSDAIISHCIPIQFSGRNKPIVSFLDNPYLVFLQREFEQRDLSAFHELGGNCTAAHAREFLVDEADVLNDLDDPDPVRAHLGLDRNDVMAAVFVEPDIEFVDLDLSNALDRRPQVVLQAVSRKAEERVDQPVVAHDRQQRLLVAHRMEPNQFRGRIGNVGNDKAVTRENIGLPEELEPVAPLAGAENDPLPPVRLRREDAVGQLVAVTERIGHVANILDPWEAERGGAVN